VLFITVVGNPVQQTQGHSYGICWLGALTNFILISHPVNTYTRCFVWCCLYAGSGHIPTETPPSTHITLGPRAQRADIRLELHPYEHQPLSKVLKHFIYIKEDLLWVWTGLGVSIPSTNRDSYSCTKHITLRSHRAYNKAGAASLWALATTFYIYI